MAFAAQVSGVDERGDNRGERARVGCDQSAVAGMLPAGATRGRRTPLLSCQGCAPFRLPVYTGASTAIQSQP